MINLSDKESSRNPKPAYRGFLHRDVLMAEITPDAVKAEEKGIICRCSTVPIDLVPKAVLEKDIR